MSQKKTIGLFLLVFFLIAALSACQSQADPGPQPTATEEELPGTVPPENEGDGEDQFIGMPNPASFYCQEMGYQLDMRETDQGTVGMCVFHDGSECEEWDFLAGRCGQSYSYCELQGYDLQQAGDIANCVFDDGSSCPEYMYFIQECQPPDSGGQ